MEDVFKTTDKRNRFDANNHEVLNPTPMQPPLGFKASPTLVEQIRQQVRALKHMDDTEPESEEEADDFNIEDDPVPHSRWENDMIPSIKETRARARALEKEARLYAAPKAAPAAPAEVLPNKEAAPVVTERSAK